MGKQLFLFKRALFSESQSVFKMQQYGTKYVLSFSSDNVLSKGLKYISWSMHKWQKMCQCEHFVCQCSSKYNVLTPQAIKSKSWCFNDLFFLNCSVIWHEVINHENTFSQCRPILHIRSVVCFCVQKRKESAWFHTFNFYYFSFSLRRIQCRVGDESSVDFSGTSRTEPGWPERGTYPQKHAPQEWSPQETSARASRGDCD